MKPTLHIHHDGQRLCVWGLDPSPEPRSLGGQDLRALVGEFLSDALLASVAPQVQITLFWPPDASARSVDALAFAGADAIDLLLALPTPLPAAFGPSLGYWRRLAEFVMQRLAGRQFYPDLEQSSDGTLRAQWRLLLHSADEMNWLERYAAQMPPVCRAVPDAAEAQRLVESFLSASADALIRRFVADDPFFQQVHARAQEPESPVDTRWLSALLGANREIAAPAEQLTMLAEQVSGWVGKLDESRSLAALRLGMQLIEPPQEQQDGWQLSLFLEPLDGQPRIPAHTLWASDPVPAGLMGRTMLYRQGQMQAQLAEAAESFPPLQRALVTGRPATLDLTVGEAHVFLRRAAGELSARNFLVQLPAWAQAQRLEPALELMLRPTDEGDDDSILDLPEGPRRGAALAASGGVGLESLLNFDWQIAVGDLRISGDEFRRLAEQGSPLVRHRGRWLDIDVEQAKRALQFMEKQARGQTTLGDALRTVFTTSRADSALPIAGVSGTSWVGQLLADSPAQKVREIPQPPGFDGTLRPYQMRGLAWLQFLDTLGIGACLADDMGLGKTIQLIALLLHERAGARRVGPTLLFAPTSVVSNWLREAQRFARSLRVMLHHGPQRLRGDDFATAAAEHDLVITSYALAYRDVEDLSRVAWHRLTLDEAQKIKNPSAASTLAIRRIQSPRRVALTGTPLENHLSELWSIMEVLNPRLLGTASEFREQFAVPIERLRQADRAELLRRMIRPFILRRTKSDPQVAGDLPEKMEMRVWCNLTAQQAAIYQRLTEEMLKRIDSASGIRRRGLILAALTRLKQVCDHPHLLEKAGTQMPTNGDLADPSGKCQRLVEMLEEVLEEGDAALIFTQYRQMGHLLQRLLEQRFGAPPLFLHGGTPARQRDEMVARFQQPGSDARLFILSLRAGGLGLNLTAANHVFHFDRWWNPAVEAQATDRAHRIGQTRKVQVHKFMCIGTLEERIDRMLSDKLALADQIVGSGDEWLTNLSTEELRQTLALSEEAIGDF